MSNDFPRIALDFAEKYMGIALQVGMFEGDTRLPGRIFSGFVTFSCGDVDSAEAMRQALNEAAVQVGAHAEQALTGAARDVSDWRGEAAANFKSYLDMVKDADRLQSECLQALSVTMYAYRALLMAMQKDVVDLVNVINQGLEDAEVRRTKIGLAMVAAVASVATLGPAALGLGLITGSSSVATEIIDGDTEYEVMLRMAEGLEALGRLFRDELQRVTGMFDRVLAWMLNNPKLTQVSPRAPELIERADFDPRRFDFGQSEEFNRRVNTGPLIPTPPRPTIH